MVVSTYSSGSYGSSGVSISAARVREENEMMINNDIMILLVFS